ncbi:unnamed protein product [Angiostrongylus costaricensis]|uniref:Uncharacterized protein n=1 Tax=Angiostrongylus costaricensis TaxID=334426 RepID=A0A0R3PTH3_ANGCS|nr:unnamed protein product [Angiostrongylus costaricensis]
MYNVHYRSGGFCVDVPVAENGSLVDRLSAEFGDEGKLTEMFWRRILDSRFVARAWEVVPEREPVKQYVWEICPKVHWKRLKLL